MESPKVIVERVSPNDVVLNFGLAQINFSLVNGQLKTTSRVNLAGGSNPVFLPDNIFAAMARQAAQILKEQQKRDYQWFVEPLDAATNDAITAGLREQGLCAAESTDELRRITDTEGQPHTVLQINYPFVSFLEKSAAPKRLRFQIFNRPGENAKARLWPFPRRRPATRRPASKKATA